MQVERALQLASMTSRERQVAEGLARGQSTAQLSVALGISPHTVRAHVASVLAKLNVRRRAEAGALATQWTVTRAGCIDESEPEITDGSLDRLTAREAEVLSLLGEGASRDVISDVLGISVHTVRTHERHLFAKLGVHSRVEAGAIARRR